MLHSKCFFILPLCLVTEEKPKLATKDAPPLQLCASSDLLFMPRRYIIPLFHNQTGKWLKFSAIPAPVVVCHSGCITTQYHPIPCNSIQNNSDSIPSYTAIQNNEIPPRSRSLTYIWQAPFSTAGPPVFPISMELVDIWFDCGEKANGYCSDFSAKSFSLGCENKRALTVPYICLYNFFLIWLETVAFRVIIKPVTRIKGLVLPWTKLVKCVSNV